MDPDTEIICSDVVRFISEWRCFVRYGEILGIRYYNGDQNAECDATIIERAVHEFSGAPVAYVLDFGVTDDGRTLLVEMNEGMAIGCYGLQDELYAKFLLARWMEIIEMKDPLAEED